MARTRDRQRALARAKLDRQIARRAAAARRRRQIQAGTATGIALVLIVLGAMWYAGVFEPEKAKPQAAVDCAWNADTAPGAKDVGRPPTNGVSKTGTETMTITTDQGVIRAALDVSKVPCAAASLSFLASKQFFDNTKCHRLTTEGSFGLWCGDPGNPPTGTGGPGYRFADENLPEPEPSATDAASPAPSASAAPALYKAGTIAMDSTVPDTNGSRFVIIYKDSPALEAKYSVIGQITGGLDVVEKVANGGVAEGGASATDGKPKVDVTIQTLTVSEPDAEPAASTEPSGTATSPAPAASQ